MKSNSSRKSNWPTHSVWNKSGFAPSDVWVSERLPFSHILPEHSPSTSVWINSTKTEAGLPCIVDYMKCKTLWGKKLLKEVRKKKSGLQEDPADRLVPNKWICLKTLWMQEKNMPFVSKPTVCLYPNCCLHGWTYVFWTRTEAESVLCNNSLLCIHLPPPILVTCKQ